MKSRLYTVYDRIAEDGGPPWVAKNDGVAARQFRKILEQVDPDSQAEYKLYYLGEYDSAQMTLTVEINPSEVLTTMDEKGRLKLAVPEVGRIVE